MLLKRLFTGLILFGFLALPSPAPAQNNNPQEAVAALNEGNQAFALDMYRQLGMKETGNLVFSPYSISSALAMTCAGASGNTEKEMAQTLHFTLPQVALHPAFAEIRKTLEEAEKRGDIKLSVANSLWPDKRYTLNPAFVETTRKNYEISITPLDFTNAGESAKTINQWVGKNTHDRIKDILQPTDLENAILVLVNAIWFKGDWMRPFEVTETRPELFREMNASPKHVPMMHQDGSFSFFEDESVQVLEKPYGGNQVFMQIVLPRTKEGLADVEKTLTPEKLAAWTAGERMEKVALTLPKFKMTPNRIDLVEILKALGMKDAFDSKKADFLSIFQNLNPAERPFISHVFHKAFIEVQEKGTEAAAATAVVMAKVMAMAPPSKPSIVFKADHPFLFLIREKTTGTILFMGRMVAPTEE